MQTEQLIGMCSVPNQETATRIAEALVEQHLAACVNIVPAVQSVYRWQDKIVHDEELLLLFKTGKQVWQQLETVIMALHPYELPEIIAVPIHSGQADYLQWIDNCLK